MKKTSILFILFFSISYNIRAQENSRLHYVSAKEFIKKDSLNLAMIELDSAIKIAPNFADAYALKGQIFEQKNESRKALSQFSLAILHNPNQPNFYLKRASLHFKLKDHRDYILNDINEVIRLNPTNSEYYELKAYYYAHTFNPKSLKPDYQNAILLLDKAIFIEPTNGRFYSHRSDYKLKNKQNLSALIDINKAIEINQSNASYYHQRAVIKFIMQDFRTSLNDITKAIKIDSTSIDYYQFRGNVYFNLKRYNQSYEDYTTSIDLLFDKIIKVKGRIASNNPLNIKLRQTLVLRGMALVQENKPFDGCDDFQKALQMGEAKAKNYVNQYCQ